MYTHTHAHARTHAHTHTHISQLQDAFVRLRPHVPFVQNKKKFKNQSAPDFFVACAPVLRMSRWFEIVVLQRERERESTHTHTHTINHTHALSLSLSLTPSLSLTIEIEVLYERFHLGNNVEVVQEIRHQMLRYYDACLAALVWG